MTKVDMLDKGWYAWPNSSPIITFVASIINSLIGKLILMTDFCQKSPSPLSHYNGTREPTVR